VCVANVVQRRATNRESSVASSGGRPTSMRSSFEHICTTSTSMSSASRHRKHVSRSATATSWRSPRRLEALEEALEESAATSRAAAAAAAAAASADIPPVTLDPDKRHSWKEEAAEARPPPFSLSPSSSSRQEDQLLLRPVRGRVALRGFLADESALAAELLTHRVFASPIVGSTGLNTKNILALEHGVPLVTTPLGAEGMHLPVPHPPFNLTSAAPPVVGVAEDAEGFAAALVQVYINESLWHVRAAGGKRHLQANFSSGAQQSALEVLLESLWKIRLPK